MVTLRYVEKQLERLGCNFKFIGRAEIRELPTILLPEERIEGAVNGRYTGGGALLVITNLRLLLIDRKPFFLTIEDIRFDMIAEIDFNSRLLNSSAVIITPAQKLVFSSIGQQRLRTIVTYLQQKVLEARQHHLIEQQFIPEAQERRRFSGSRAGNLAIQGSTSGPIRTVPINPYAKMPLVIRRRR